MDTAPEKLRERGRFAYPRSAEDRKKGAASVCARVSATTAFQKATFVAIFYPQLWEVDLLPLWKEFPDKCVFPRTYPDSGELRFYSLAALAELRPAFGRIPAPPEKASRAITKWKASDLILVPGLCFDRVGGRLGTGFGFYDRFLRGLKAQRWGVCWEGQVVDSALPQHANDVNMGALCTERMIEYF